MIKMSLITSLNNKNCFNNKIKIFIVKLLNNLNIYKKILMKIKKYLIIWMIHKSLIVIVNFNPVKVKIVVILLNKIKRWREAKVVIQWRSFRISMSMKLSRRVKEILIKRKTEPMFFFRIKLFKRRKILKMSMMLSSTVFYNYILILYLYYILSCILSYYYFIKILL
jgi:hypothetical protein